MADTKQSDEFQLLEPLSAFPECKENQFSIMSWNILIKSDTNQNASSECCKWEYRLSKIQNTILSFKSDIVCLQECHAPSFIDDFASFCTKNGYEFKLNHKETANNNTSDCDQTPKYSEMATAILWKADTFRCKHHDFRSKATILLLEIMNNETKLCTTLKTIDKRSKNDKPPNAAQIYSNEKNERKWHSLKLEEKQSYIKRAQLLNKEWKLAKQKMQQQRANAAIDAMKSYVFITNVHLEAHGNITEKKMNKNEMRFNQIKHSIERIVNYTRGTLHVNDMKNVQSVFCGDFNAEKDSEVDNMLRSKSNGNTFIHELDLKNAYVDNIKNSKKEIVSHWVTKRLIDHFYYTRNNLRCMLCIDPVPDFMQSNDAILDRIKYPNKDIVSDHLPVAAMFEIKEIKHNPSEIHSGKKRTFAMIEERQNNNANDIIEPPTHKQKV